MHRELATISPETSLVQAKELIAEILKTFDVDKSVDEVFKKLITK